MPFAQPTAASRPRRGWLLLAVLLLLLLLLLCLAGCTARRSGAVAASPSPTLTPTPTPTLSPTAPPTPRVGPAAPACPEAGPSPSLACDKAILLSTRDTLTDDRPGGLPTWQPDVPLHDFTGVAVGGEPPGFWP